MALRTTANNSETAIHRGVKQGEAQSTSLPWRARLDFQELFERIGDGQANGTEVLEGTQMQIVVGIAVGPQSVDERAVHRETWFKSPLVCRGNFGTPAGCVILPKFILERGSMPPEQSPKFGQLLQERREHSDIAFVPGVLADKSRQWIAEAAKQYPNAKYIGKMDSDTYLSPRNLIKHILGSEEWYHTIDYYGYFLAGDTGGFTPENPCDMAKECCRPPAECTDADGFSDKCWVYAQGGFYLVSRAVAEHVDKLLREQHPSAMKYDCEDSILGKWIQSAPSRNQVWGKGTNRCLCDCLKSDMLAWYHFYYNQNGYLDMDDRCIREQ